MPSTAPSSGDPEVLETFFDRRVPQLLRAQGIPGAAVVVVAGDRQVFAEGYGHADLDRRVPVVADRTAFPIASVSKTITATAAMHLVEQGTLPETQCGPRVRDLGDNSSTSRTAAPNRFARQTIYRCLRRMAGQEPRSAHRDLEHLGADRLQLRA